VIGLIAALALGGAVVLFGGVHDELAVDGRALGDGAENGSPMFSEDVAVGDVARNYDTNLPGHMSGSLFLGQLGAHQGYHPLLLGPEHEHRRDFPWRADYVEYFEGIGVFTRDEFRPVDNPSRRRLTGVKQLVPKRRPLARSYSGNLQPPDANIGPKLSLGRLAGDRHDLSAGLSGGPGMKCGSAWKRDPVSGVIGVE